MIAERPIRVLIVDDSAMIRKVLHLGLSSDDRFEVIGTAARASVAEEMIREHNPDLITLDIEMPGMSGIEFLQSRRGQKNIPTVIISAHTPREAELSIKALELGALDVIEKPSGGLAQGLSGIMADIRQRLVNAASAKQGGQTVSVRKPVLTDVADRQPIAKPETLVPRTIVERDWLFAIGASTGGVQALSAILPQFPYDSPGIVIVQHMPRGFTKSFADRLNEICQMTVKEAEHGDEVRAGQILLAPGGDHHMIVRKTPSTFRVHLIEGDPVCFSRPSVDVLFESVAREVGNKVTAAILTGMGKDGANGMLKIRESGGRTFAQNEESCVVFGMPHAAHERNASETLVPLDDIPTTMMNSIGKLPKNQPQTRQAAPVARLNV